MRLPKLRTCGYARPVFDPQMELLLTLIQPILESSDPSWAALKSAVAACGEIEEDVALAIELEDQDELRVIHDEWMEGKRHLMGHDRDVLKRAMKAYRKRLKVTLLDAESSLGGGPMSGGRKSTITGVRPPDRYPTPVWMELVRQGRLVDGGRGLFELPPGG